MGQHMLRGLTTRQWLQEMVLLRRNQQQMSGVLLLRILGDFEEQAEFHAWPITAMIGSLRSIRC
jgi:hypothetical protein